MVADLMTAGARAVLQAPAAPGGQERPFSALVLGVRNGEVLLCRGPDAWCLPGGKLEPGETSAAAAAREFLEETGRALPVALGAPVCATTHDGKPMDVYAVELPRSFWETGGWDGPEGRCAFVSFARSIELYRADWRDAYAAALLLAVPDHSAAPAAPGGQHG